jgi:hypothetical protein
MAAEEPAAEQMTPLAAWRRRTATGMVLSAVALGLQEALEPKDEKPALVIEADGEPTDDEPISAYLVPGMPEASWVVVRPWLLNKRPQD